MLWTTPSSKPNGTESRGFTPHFIMERARLARAQGHDELYRDLYGRAIDAWREMGAGGWVERYGSKTP